MHTVFDCGLFMLLRCRDREIRLAEFHDFGYFQQLSRPNGVPLKVAQRFARHSCITLMMDYDPHLLWKNLAAAVTLLPSVSPVIQTCPVTGKDHQNDLTVCWV